MTLAERHARDGWPARGPVEVRKSLTGNIAMFDERFWTTSSPPSNPRPGQRAVVRLLAKAVARDRAREGSVDG
jgi:hypothetical protein